MSKIEKPGMKWCIRPKPCGLVVPEEEEKIFLLLKINLFVFIYVFISLLIYIQVNPNKVGKPTRYRTSPNELNVDTKQLRGRITMHTLLEIFVKVKL